LKETEIGKIPEGWNLYVFSQAIDVNPRRELKKGAIAKKVSMQGLQEFRRKIASYERAKYNGGTKFQNNDTLMARITPCLENGKTAFVDILDNNEIGFGSTEFNVLCGEEGKTDHKFVYYLSRSPLVRAEAINSMVGTSGRQRVQNDVFDNMLVPIPSIAEQKSIAKILSDLDSKIELNIQMNKNLESIGQGLFKHWFVDFEFPNNEGKPYKSSGGGMVDSELGEVPKGWKAGKLEEIIENFDSKRIPLSSREREKRRGQYPYHGAVGVMDFIDDYIFDGEYLLMGEDGTVTDSNGFPILQYVWGKFWVNNHAHIIRGKEGIPLIYLLLFLKNTNVSHIITGAVQPKINQRNMNSIEIIIPDKKTLSNFNHITSVLYSLFKNNTEENNSLVAIRDSLLTRLMSGRIRVPIGDTAI